MRIRLIVMPVLGAMMLAAVLNSWLRLLWRIVPPKRDRPETERNVIRG